MPALPAAAPRRDHSKLCAMLCTCCHVLQRKAYHAVHITTAFRMKSPQKQVLRRAASAEGQNNSKCVVHEPYRSLCSLATLAGSSPLPELSCPESWLPHAGSAGAGGSASGSGGTGGGRGDGMLLGAGSSAAGGGAFDATACVATAPCAALASASSGSVTPVGDTAVVEGIGSSLPSGGVTTPAGKLPVQALAPSPLAGLATAEAAAMSASPAAAA